MPSHKIHIKIANEINKKIKLDSDKLLLGSVLPDLTRKMHYVSHFKTIKDDHKFYNIDLFMKKYNLNNEILMGYLIHLLTDKFFNDYVRKKYFVFKDNKLCGIKSLNGVIYDNPSVVCDIKQEDFHNYDLYLLNNEEFPKIDYKSFIGEMPIIDECDYSLEYIKKYVNLYNNEIDKCDYILNDYIYITKDELDKLVNDCINYILNFMQKKEIQ